MISPIKEFNDILAIEKIPLEERVPYNTVYAAFKAAALRFGDKIALTALPVGEPLGQATDISYTTLLEKTHQTANFFLSRGLKNNQTVSHILPICIEAYYTMLAAEAVGITNPINPMLDAEHIAGILKAANTKILVVPSEAVAVDLWGKIQEIIELVPEIHTVMVLGGNEACDGEKFFDFDRAISGQKSNAVSIDVEVNIDSPVAYFHTGGTTGLPKLAPHTQRMRLANIAATGIPMGYDEGDIIPVGLPLFHVTGSIILGSIPIMYGARLIILSPIGFRDASVVRDYWNIIEKYKATMLCAVPTVLSALLNIPIGGANISSLREAYTGGAVTPLEVLVEMSKIIGFKVSEGLGMTEVASYCTMPPRGGVKKFGSVGYRLPYTKMKVVVTDANDDIVRDAETNEIGNILWSGPTVFPGYLQEPHNKTSFTADGWFNSGDLARVDDEGYIWVTGRSKDLIIRSGHNIDPTIIEDAFYEHPSVELAAAIGKPDVYAGELPVAYVQLKMNAKATIDELMAFVLDKIPERAAVPKDIFIIEVMPMTAVGKIFKPSLRYHAISHVYEQALNDLDVVYSVNTAANKTHSTLATITVEGEEDPGIAQKIQDILTPYTVRSKVVWR